MGYDASEVFELADDIERNATLTHERASRVVHKTGFDTVATMGIIHLSGVAFDTGNLMNSEGVDFHDSGLGFEAGPTAEYGGYVEEGTSRMSAQPYAGPAADRTFPVGVEALADVAGMAISRG